MSYRQRLRDVFVSPPRGGNERGVQTSSSMAPLPVPTGAPEHRGPYVGNVPERPTLEQFKDAGVLAARSNILHSSAAGVPDFRNFDRGYDRVTGGAPKESLYDMEENLSGTGHAGDSEAGPRMPMPKPVIVADTSMPSRVDGKPLVPMGTANGNRSNYLRAESERDNTSRPK